MRKLLFIIFIISCCSLVNSQDELEWKGEVEAINSKKYEFDANKKGLIILTGSSSARMWTSFADVVPEYNSRNHGFGGSQMHELLFFLDELVLNHKPDKILIYEGDNDIGVGKSSDEIMATTLEVVRRIRDQLPDSDIFLISPKPSLARWDLAEKYVELNGKMEAFCDTKEKLTYIDVWNPMLDETGKPIKEIFIEDGLHMNADGYKIWEEAVGKKVN
jgi:lysophospholipase L1-like esterase